MTLRKLAILGGGAVARALGPRLSGAGLEVLAWTRDPADSQPVGRAVTLGEAGQADAAWILVSDGAISEVCGRLVAAGGPPVVLHGSGYFGTQVLGDAACRGVLHPLVSFPGGATPDLTGAGASVSGDGEGRAAAREVATALGLEVFELSVDPLVRARYHAAASLCANGAAALFDIALGAQVPGEVRAELQQACVGRALGALGVSGDAGGGDLPPAPDPAETLSEQALAVHALLAGHMREPLVAGTEPGAVMSLCVNGALALIDLAVGLLPKGADRATAGRAFAHLTGGVLRRVATHGPRGALTGPVSRGDAEVVSGHLEVLPPEAGEVYRVLAGRMLDLSDLDSDQVGVIRALLAE